MQPKETTSAADEKRLTVLRGMVWLYFALLVVEGALRKWIVPSLSTPLLVVRDPLVLLIYVQAVRCRRFPFGSAMLVYFALLSSFMLLALVQIVSGIGGGPFVAIYGLRTNFLHLPLIFVIPRIISFQDVVRFGKWLLTLSVPMALLMVVQFMSPPASRINAAIGDGQQISFAMGKVRAAGTFSFVTGAAHFFILVTAFLIFGLAQRRTQYPRWLLGAALIGLLVVQPASGSRTLVLGCALTGIAALVFGALSRRQAPKILVAAIMVGATLAVLSFTSFFREAVEVFMVRWNTAADGDAAGTMSSRVLDMFIDPFSMIPHAGFFGKGLGLGTNAGSALATGVPQFLLAEGEWSRIILESGPFLGFSFLLYRVFLAGSIAIRSFASARRQNLLAWLLAWDACRSLINEQLSQPTNLGFMVFVCGLCLAAMPERRSAFTSSRVIRRRIFPRHKLQFEGQI